MAIKNNCLRRNVIVLKKGMLGKTPSLLVLRGARHPVGPVLFVSCLDCCQEPLAHFLQERHLQPLNELSAAHASVHGAFGGIKIRRVINKLRGLPAENSERHAHRDEVQTFLPIKWAYSALPLFWQPPLL